jgi:hypothetical protein
MNLPAGHAFPLVESVNPKVSPMSRNTLYGLIGVLAVIVVGFGIYFIYQEQQKPALEIKVNEQGISIDGNG